MKRCLLTVLFCLASFAIAQTEPPGQHAVGITCTESTPSVTFNFLRAPTASGPFVTLNASPLPACAYTDTTVALQTQYFYEAQAVDSGGQATSPPLTVNVPGVPAAPASLAIVATSSVANLTWPASGSQVTNGYNIYRGPTATALAKIGSATATAYADSTVTPGSTYFYAVTATSPACSTIPNLTTSSLCGESAYSTIVSTTIPSPPTPPGQFVITIN